MSWYEVKCRHCHHEFGCKGTADYQSCGDGPAESTGVELDDAVCPICGIDDIEILSEADADDADHDTD